MLGWNTSLLANPNIKPQQVHPNGPPPPPSHPGMSQMNFPGQINPQIAAHQQAFYQQQMIQVHQKLQNIYNTP